MAKIMENLFGEYISKNDGEKVTVRSLCGKDKVIGIYFSAGWCKPCRGFTPILMELYKKLKQSANKVKLEIILVSSDKEEKAFKEYFAEMPWLALPYNQGRKIKVCKRFRVQGIPRLVLMDGENGKTINTEGYACLMDDLEGKGFPWRRKEFWEIIKGKVLKNKSEEVDSVDAFKGNVIGLYFSAHWCPPCRVFTTELVKTYEKLKSKGKNFEVLFVTSDRSSSSFEQYFESMPWYALPRNDKRSDALKMSFGVDSIPTLAMLDETGNLITLNGRTAIHTDKDCVDFPWYPKALTELTGSAAVQLNEMSCLVLFTEGEEDEVRFAKEALIDCAKEEHDKGEHQELQFFYGGDDEICDTVRDFANLEDRSPLLVILDFPEQRVFVSPDTNITKDVTSNFVNGFLNGKLVPKSIRR